VQEDWVLCRVFYKSTAAAPRPASDESSGSLSSDLGVAPALQAPINAAVGYGQQDSTGPLPGAHHWPAAPLPLQSFRDLLGDMVQGSGGDPHADWSVDDSGYTRQGGMSQSWNAF
jgi:hypothetical protein